MDIDTLYPLVTEAIRKAEALEERSDPAACQAFSEVSRLEEQIAHVVPLSDYEGVIARRGAVRAAIKAHQSARAMDLIARFEAETGVHDELAGDLSALKAEAISLAMQDQERFADLVALPPVAEDEALDGHRFNVIGEYLGGDRLVVTRLRAESAARPEIRPARLRDKLVLRLTYAVLTVIVALPLASFVAPVERRGRVLDIVIGLVPALIAVYGTIMGFYFGERRALARNGRSVAEHGHSPTSDLTEPGRAHERAFGQG